MGISINSNIASLIAQRRLAESNTSLASTFERLSSGQRINNAADDPAGLAISETLNSNSRVYTQAIRNVSDGISALNITQGALEQLTTITMRQKELITQAANGTYSLAQREAMNTEVNALVDEYNRITQSTEFNGIRLTDRSQTQLNIQAGYGSTGALGIKITDELARTVGSGSFQGFVSSVTGGSPRGITAGDVNGDGVMDLISAEYGSGTVTVLIGNGNGTYLARNSFTAGSQADSVVVADFNGDGKLDMASADRGANTTSVFLGNGNGTFNARISFNVAGGPCDIAYGDVNNDGSLDLIMGNFAGTSTSVVLGNGNGTFKAAISNSAGVGIYGVQVGDLNNDGKLDIVGSGHGGSEVYVWMGNGDGTFGARRSLASGTSTAPVDVAIGDFNRDGFLDLAAANINNSTLSLFVGNGDGTFEARTTLDGGSNPLGVEFGDLNGDGNLDLVSAANASNQIIVHFGNGNGTFGGRVSFTTSSGPRALYVGDLNRDGVADIANAGTQIGTLIANTTTVTTTPYLNINTAENARAAMQTIDSTLSRISSELGLIGSNQARLGVELNTLSVARNNFDAAESRIKDADIAFESANLVRQQILQQASAAVLGQANQQPALALRLLKS